MHKVTFDWFHWQVSLGQTHRHEHGREDAKFRWPLTLLWLGLAKSTGQTVRHSVADTFLLNKLATLIKKIHCLVNLHRNLLTFWFACFPVYSWKAKPFFPKYCYHKWDSEQPTIQLWIPPQNTAKEKLFPAGECWLSGQVDKIATGRTLQVFIRVSYEVEFYVYSQDWA